MTFTHQEPRGFIGSVIILGVSAVLAVCFDYLVIDKALGIGFPLFILILLVGGFSVVKKKHFDSELLWILVPLLFFSWMVFVRASVLLTALNLLTCLFLVLLLGDILTGKKLRNLVFMGYAEILILPVKLFPALGRTLSDLISLKGVHRHSDKVSRILKGVFMALPVLIVFGLLFSSADLLFQKYATDLFTFQISEDTFAHFIRIIVFTCAFIGGLSYISSTVNPAEAPASKKFLSLGILEVSVFLGAINLLFVFFLFLQAMYLFGGAENIVSQGFTYAEYARKGFFELIAVAVFSFLILWKTEENVEKKEGLHHSAVFKYFSGALVFQVFVIMASAFMRLSLYEDAYGFTTLRLYSHAFILFLCAVFLVLLYKILVDRRENAFAHRIYLSVIAFLVCMNLLNPDAFIARQNISHFANVPDKLDTSYLQSLSTDAVPEIWNVLNVFTERNKKDISFRAFYPTKHDSAQDDWQSLNLSRLRAKELFRTHVEGDVIRPK